MLPTEQRPLFFVEEPMNYYYRNFYECPCGETWEDEWDSTCDDRCPSCDTSVSPSSSIETGLCLALQAAIDLYQDCWHEVNNYGDQDTPDKCDRWADECLRIMHSFPDFFEAEQFSAMATSFKNWAEELRAESYGA